MKNIKQVSKIVEQVLEEKEICRNSDTELYVETCLRINPIACQLPMSRAMRDRKRLGLPNYESVTRAKRKIQADREDLRGCEAVSEGRYEAFKEVLDYVSE